MKHLYIRCNDGHYFTGESCPFDAWGSPETVKLAKLAGTIPPDEYSIAKFQAEGISNDLLRRLFVAEFGDERAAFQGLAPEYYIIDGKKVYKFDTDERFL